MVERPYHAEEEEVVVVQQTRNRWPETGDITSMSSDEDNEIDPEPSNHQLAYGLLSEEEKRGLFRSKSFSEIATYSEIHVDIAKGKFGFTSIGKERSWFDLSWICPKMSWIFPKKIKEPRSPGSQHPPFLIGPEEDWLLTEEEKQGLFRTKSSSEIATYPGLLGLRTYSESTTYSGIHIDIPKGQFDCLCIDKETSWLDLSGICPKKKAPGSQHPPFLGGPEAGEDEGQFIPGEIRSKSFEILKCIVHGGLMESIASLSFVYSAAAFDATTPNIIALGVASAICGLLVFSHNLMGLKNPNENEETDRYQEILGTRGHFLFHATFAILSFLVFGTIPPLVYGFTFRESDSKDYKILAVAAASFASVFILGIGKAYVTRSQKLSEYAKTILYYIVVAVSVSGVAYAAGYLIKMLMVRDRIGWFQPNQTAPLLVPDAISATPKWASY